jgi:hypothetical protein
MAVHGINRQLARTVSWSTAMATATYGIEVIYEGQQRIVMTTGAGFLGPGMRDKQAERVERNDGWHSSEVKLSIFLRDVLLFVCFSFSFVGFASYCHVQFYIIVCFLLPKSLFSVTRGASSPEWVKPAAEGGRICFLFRILQFRYMFVIVFIYLAIMADGR